MSNWICDDSGKLKAQANVVETSSVQQTSNKLNALWAEGQGLCSKHEKVQYFEVSIDQEDSGVWVGFGNKSRFGSGWKCKALNYGGNLSDGGGLMRSSFGPQPKTGDVIGLRGEIDGADTLHIHFSHNGVPLGKGFEIEKSGGYGPFFPVVCLNSGPGKVTIVRKPPPSAGSMEKSSGGARTSEQGSWSVNASALNSEYTPELPHDLVHVVFNIKTEAEKWIVGAKVANMLRGAVSAQSPHVSTGQVISTKMMPSPKLAKVESSVADVLRSITDLGLTSSGQLRIEAGTREYLLDAYTEELRPVARNELNW